MMTSRPRSKCEPQMSAPLEAGAVVGTIKVQLGDELVASRDLITLGAVEEAGFFGRTWDSMRIVDGRIVC